MASMDIDMPLDDIPAKTPASTVAAAADKLVVSNLAQTVTERDVRELFARIGPVRSAQLNYNAEGKSKGVANVVFSKHGDAARAFAEYNGRTLDDRPMRIELVVNPEAPAIARLAAQTGTGRGAAQAGGRAAGSGGITKKAAPSRQTARRGTGRRQRSPKKDLSAADLDAEMDSYIAGSSGAAAAPAADASQLANALM
ncbi:RNA-binding RNA annealing protein [Polyrhizophydium stewartii]|uniref:RNA-binding RNA annealing protein n=1 Tax=Polyrhizophydium stewartii TaxID=2732419 RepID=A0ABR4NDM6_9FUNG